MLSPFPGMDPYLEDPIGWPDLHQGFITALRTELNRVLPPQYRARMGERLYVVQPDRSIFPDVMVVERPASPPARDHGGGTAVAVASDPPWVITALPAEFREVFVEIVSVRGAHRLVAVVEVLSPT